VHKLTVLLVVSIILLAVVLPCLIYDTPIFATDNFTASANVSIDLWNPGDLQNALTNGLSPAAWGSAIEIALKNVNTASLSQQETFITDLVGGILGFLICVIISAWGVLKDNAFVTLMAVPIDMLFGLSFATNYTPGSANWVIGLIMAIIGTYLLFRTGWRGWQEFRKKRASK
jgi:hypothetical protein